MNTNSNGRDGINGIFGQSTDPRKDGKSDGELDSLLEMLFSDKHSTVQQEARNRSGLSGEQFDAVMEQEKHKHALISIEETPTGKGIARQIKMDVSTVRLPMLLGSLFGHMLNMGVPATALTTALEVAPSYAMIEKLHEMEQVHNGEQHE